MKIVGLIKNLLALMTVEQRRRFYLLQALVILSALTELVSITAIGPFVALVGNMELLDSNPALQAFSVISGVADKFDFLLLLGSAIIFVLVTSTFLNILGIRKLSIFAAEVGAEFGDTLYDYYLNKEYLYHANTNSSLLIKQIATEVGRVTDNIFQPLVQINARIISVLLISGFLFIYNHALSLAGMLVFSICYSILFYFVRDRLAQNGNSISEASKKRFRLMNESFSAVKEITVLGCQKTFIDDFHKSGQRFSSAYGSSNGLYNSPRYLIELLVFGFMILGLLLSVYLDNGNLTDFLPTLSVFAIAIFKLLPSFQQIYSGSAQIRGNYSAFLAIRDDLYSAREKQTSVMLIVPEVSDNIVISGDIVLSDVKFKYPGKEAYVLDGISMNIPEGSFIGIAGASGSGKSTLFDLLLGVIFANHGQITIGGVPISKNNICNWQNKIGYVSQTVFLKDGTLAENIAFGIPEREINWDRINDVINKAQLAPWVRTLSDGANSQVGESGVQISGGQKQRIGIARALYHDADVLFFDEATSALDSLTEKKIMKSIVNLNKKKTIIMIAHRLNTLKKCDRLYFFKDGKIIDEGTYDSLLETNRQFKMMAVGIQNEP
ncbi:ABC transporter ATP-binding protein [Endozoicomonas sp. SESOKO1]|uniref:ABC transporter ATP-binding protein n=1 Tax=Endozoicomonas sp. SESOKO1 TaxID=2828742 RepID=UPI002148AB8A|nr:ABC transporter ATP-binding protein [Endozoicomonas sp. SESOKO1]